jgi:hypothetical protein
VSDAFTSPVKWCSSLVGTWPRFSLFSLFLTALIWLALYAASNSQWHGAAWGLGFFLSAFLITLIYALRRVLVALERAESSSGFRA